MDNYKLIPLTLNKFAIVDSQDFNWLSQFKWYFNKNGYARRRIDKNTQIYMHQEILNKYYGFSGLETDHINLNRLDNRKANLRIAYKQQNRFNSPTYKNNKVGYKGVILSRQTHKYHARIIIDNKQKHLGCFTTPEGAALAYNKAAKEYFGEFARLNYV